MLTKEKGVVPATKVCRICLKNRHPTDMYPLLQEDTATIKAIGGYPHGNFYQQNKLTR